MIENANNEDAKQIAEIVQKTFGKDYAPTIIDENLIQQKMSEDKNHFIVAKENDKVIGVIRTEKADVDLADLRWVCVVEEFRNKGIATELINKALEYLKEIGMRKVITKTKGDNKNAVELFSNLGFEQEGYFKEHFRKGTDIIQFAKFL